MPLRIVYDFSQFTSWGVVYGALLLINKSVTGINNQALNPSHMPLPKVAEVGGGKVKIVRPCGFMSRLRVISNQPKCNAKLLEKRTATRLGRVRFVGTLAGGIGITGIVLYVWEESAERW